MILIEAQGATSSLTDLPLHGMKLGTGFAKRAHPDEQQLMSGQMYPRGLIRESNVSTLHD